jgi:DNA-binding LacI/PurR family transcriptional regulator
MASNSKYKYFSELIEKEINRGKYSINDYLPSERQLSEESGLSRITIRMGLKVLCEKGLLISTPGKGYKVLSVKKKHFMRRSGRIGVIFAGPQSNYPSNLMTDGIFEVFHDADYQFVFASCQLSVVRQRKIIKTMVKRDVDGLLIVPEYRKTRHWEDPDEDGNYALLKNIYDNGVPVVLIDRSFKSSGLPCVCNDDPGIAAMAVEYLVNRGHRKIVSFQAVNIGRIYRRRYNGYLEAMRKHGLTPMIYNLDKFYRLPIHSPEAYKAELIEAELIEMFREFPDATGFIIPTIWGGHFEKVLSSGNFKEQVEYIGTDRPISNNINAPYLRRPMCEIGHRAAKKIIKLIHNQPIKQMEEYLKPEIITERVAVSIHIESQFC